MDFIKKLITGIVSFLTGLLPGKKKKSNGYYLELDEANEPKPLAIVKEAASNAKQATEKALENAKQATQTVASNAKKTAQTLTSDTSNTSDTPAPSKPEPTNGTKAAASKAKPAKEAKPPAQDAKPLDVELVQTAEGLKVQPGKNAKASAAKAVKEEPKETTFAPKYVAASVGTSNGRRRPGANMSAYLDMARQVKTPG
ncbi:MAG: hypothetical protein KME32_04910 [Mojavia pulchra JT2-VF2]|jgi:chromosomal replication initiation ATPase DnaA|uniref:Uncharacterized protein n=1 Tax=Mojavia pulchra JT2-VF2 TaxID=287848 RepID=A0A951UG32_9NOST|nr:hypothetical protein [Mojavia pulchra JT2-VF2]